MKTTLQVPLDKKVKETGEKVAEEFGYSSLQELVRVFLKQFITGRIVPSFSGYDEFLTSEQEAVLNKKYLQVKEEIRKGRNVTVKKIDQLMRNLNGN